MESTPHSRTSQIGEDIFIILITAAQLIFFAFYHEYIAWPITGADGTGTRLSMLTDDYSTWLPFVIVASTIVIVASLVTMVYGNYWFRQAVWVGFCFVGIAVTVSLLLIFPFDFSVIPNAKTADLVPKALRVFLILWAGFYGTMALFLSMKLRREYRQTNEQA